MKHFTQICRETGKEYKVLTKGERGWQVVLYHRDIQPFADDGRYPKALTVVSPAT